MALSEKDRAYYAAMQVTFDTPGWQQLQDGWQKELDSLSDIVFFNAKSMDDIYTARVRYGLLKELLDLPAQLEQQYNVLVEEETEGE